MSTSDNPVQPGTSRNSTSFSRSSRRSNRLSKDNTSIYPSNKRDLLPTVPGEHNNIDAAIHGYIAREKREKLHALSQTRKEPAPNNIAYIPNPNSTGKQPKSKKKQNKKDKKKQAISSTLAHIGNAAKTTANYLMPKKKKKSTEKDDSITVHNNTSDIDQFPLDDKFLDDLSTGFDENLYHEGDTLVPIQKAASKENEKNNKRNQQKKQHDTSTPKNSDEAQDNGTNKHSKDGASHLKRKTEDPTDSSSTKKHKDHSRILDIVSISHSSKSNYQIAFKVWLNTVHKENEDIMIPKNKIVDMVTHPQQPNSLASVEQLEIGLDYTLHFPETPSEESKTIKLTEWICSQGNTHVVWIPINRNNADEGKAKPEGSKNMWPTHRICFNDWVIYKEEEVIVSPSSKKKKSPRNQQPEPEKKMVAGNRTNLFMFVRSENSFVTPGYPVTLPSDSDMEKATNYYVSSSLHPYVKIPVWLFLNSVHNYDNNMLGYVWKETQDVQPDHPIMRTDSYRDTHRNSCESSGSISSICSRTSISSRSYSPRGPIHGHRYQHKYSVGSSSSRCSRSFSGRGRHNGGRNYHHPRRNQNYPPNEVRVRTNRIRTIKVDRKLHSHLPSDYVNNNYHQFGEERKFYWIKPCEPLFKNLFYEFLFRPKQKEGKPDDEVTAATFWTVIVTYVLQNKSVTRTKQDVQKWLDQIGIVFKNEDNYVWSYALVVEIVFNMRRMFENDIAIPKQFSQSSKQCIKLFGYKVDVDNCNTYANNYYAFEWETAFGYKIKFKFITDKSYLGLQRLPIARYGNNTLKMTMKENIKKRRDLNNESVIDNKSENRELQKVSQKEMMNLIGTLKQLVTDGDDFKNVLDSFDKLSIKLQKKKKSTDNKDENGNVKKKSKDDEDGSGKGGAGGNGKTGGGTGGNGESGTGGNDQSGGGAGGNGESGAGGNDQSGGGAGGNGKSGAGGNDQSGGGAGGNGESGAGGNDQSGGGAGGNGESGAGGNDQSGGDTGVNDQSGGDTGVSDQSGSGTVVNDQSGGGTGVNDQSGVGTVVNGESGGGTGVNDQSGGGTVVNDQSGGGTVVNDQSGSGTQVNDQSGGGTVVNDQSGGGTGVNDQSGGGTVVNGKSGAGTVINDQSDGGTVINDQSDGGTVVNGKSDGGTVVNDQSDGGTVVNDQSAGDIVVNDQSGGGTVVNDQSGGGTVVNDQSGGGTQVNVQSGGGTVVNDQSVGGTGINDQSDGGTVVNRESVDGTGVNDQSGGGTQVNDQSGGGAVVNTESGGGTQVNDQSGGGTVVNGESGAGTQVNVQSGGGTNKRHPGAISEDVEQVMNSLKEVSINQSMEIDTDEVTTKGSGRVTNINTSQNGFNEHMPPPPPRNRIPRRIAHTQHASTRASLKETPLFIKKDPLLLAIYEDRFVDFETIFYKKLCDPLSKQS